PIISAAYLLTVTELDHLIFPSATCSSTIYSVIILAMLAGGFASSAFISNKICPVLASIRMADFAANCNAGTSVAACTDNGWMKNDKDCNTKLRLRTSAAV